jgi:hypothetical protein
VSYQECRTVQASCSYYAYDTYSNYSNGAGTPTVVIILGVPRDVRPCCIGIWNILVAILVGRRPSRSVGKNNTVIRSADARIMNVQGIHEPTVILCCTCTTS